MRRAAPFVGTMIVAAAAVAPATAQSRHGVYCDPGRPSRLCDPSLYMFGRDQNLAVRPRNPSQRSKRPINTLRELFAELSACWTPPVEISPGMELTVQLSFKADGSLLGLPRITYFAKTASDKVRDRYRESVLDSFGNCTPLHFTSTMGGAIAGRPMTMRFIDDRNTQKVKREGSRYE